MRSRQGWRTGFGEFSRAKDAIEGFGERFVGGLGIVWKSCKILNFEIDDRRDETWFLIINHRTFDRVEEVNVSLIISLWSHLSWLRKKIFAINAAMIKIFHSSFMR